MAFFVRRDLLLAPPNWLLVAIDVTSIFQFQQPYLQFQYFFAILSLDTSYLTTYTSQVILQTCSVCVQAYLGFWKCSAVTNQILEMGSTVLLPCYCSAMLGVPPCILKWGRLETCALSSSYHWCSKTYITIFKHL